MSNKYLFFACLGLLGGLLGALLAEPPMILPNTLPRSIAGNAFFLIFITVVWVAIFSTAIAFSLMIAERLYRRNKQSIWNILLRAAGAGVLGGIVGGGFAQLLFGLMPQGWWFTEIFVRAFCWGLMGVVVGCGISLFIPNMKLIRGALGGFCGGLLGGFGFVLMIFIMTGLLKGFLGEYFSGLISRLAGIGILGVALGLAVVIAERLFQKASLEIIWLPGQTSRITLGEKPVTIGSRGDDIVIPGFKSNTAAVILAGGNVQYVDNRTGKRTDLKNGSKLKIGTVQLVIHAKA
jgi:Ca-activated chloride channel family protein